MATNLTRAELADMVDSEDILGKTVEYIYTSGPNRRYPVYMEFERISFPFGENTPYLVYTLTNPNTEAYVNPKEFVFNKEEFIENLLYGQNRLVSITIVEQEPRWSV